jgi:hypothetical protein
VLNHDCENGLQNLLSMTKRIRVRDREETEKRAVQLPADLKGGNEWSEVSNVGFCQTK